MEQILLTLCMYIPTRITEKRNHRRHIYFIYLNQMRAFGV